MIEHEVSFGFKARYYKSGDIDPSTKQIWFVLHGYGQLAQYFIKKFSILQDYHICVIAPEGLSRFYLEELQAAGRKNNRVGATWMTRENREMDIENYIQYLNSIFKKEVAARNIPTTILGFSQGSATACRWVLNGQVDFKKLILWSGIFPPDMDFARGSTLLHNKEIHAVYGTRDPFLTDARFVEMNELVKKLDVKVSELRFDGEHDIHGPTLLKLI
jgi:predicted esterase